jgi:hypothetical protein
VVSLLFRRLGLPQGASLHSLRHSHGSHLLADGVPLAMVSERLGHSSVRTTAEVYAHALRGQDDEAARRAPGHQPKVGRRDGQRANVVGSTLGPPSAASGSAFIRCREPLAGPQSADAPPMTNKGSLGNISVISELYSVFASVSVA